MSGHTLREVAGYGAHVCINCWVTEDDEPSMAAPCNTLESATCPCGEPMNGPRCSDSLCQTQRRKDLDVPEGVEVETDADVPPKAEYSAKARITGGVPSDV